MTHTPRTPDPGGTRGSSSLPSDDDGGMTRRDLAKRGAQLAAVLGLAQYVPTSLAAAATGPGSNLFPDLHGQTITMVTYGGTSQKALEEAYAKPFSKRTGLKILQDAPVDYSKVKAQVQAKHVTWDAFDGDPNTSVAFCRDHLAEPLSPSTLRGIDKKYYSGKCGLPINVYAAVLAYDAQKFGARPPFGWKDFFNTSKYPGKRGMWSVLALNQLEVALLADGVPPKKLYPLDIDRAIRKLDTIKKDIIFFDSLGESTEQMVARSVVMSCQVNTRAYPAVLQGAPFKPAWHQAVLAWEVWQIPKGSPNKAAAEAFLRWMGTAVAQARTVKSLTFGSTATHPITPKGLSRNVLDWLPTTPKNSKTAVAIQPAWWAAHLDEATEKFTNWATS